MPSDGRESISSTAYLLREWVRRDFRARYTQTVLGSVWALIQPVTMTAAFVFVFGHVANIEVGMPYASFVYPAMLLWTLFVAGVSGASAAMLASINIAAKASYPRVVAPISGAVLPLSDFVIGLLLMPVLFAVQRPQLQFRPVSFLLAVVGVVLLAVGVGTALSALAVFVRDVLRMLPLALQMLLYLTPVAYPASRIPDWLAASPLATYVQGMRSAFLRVPGPSAGRWAVALSVSVAATVLGMAYFHRVESRIPDVA